ncbi:glycine zipper domain-containing protein [Caballeronia sp. LZ032]|uniref:DUF883 family protein n=1 Tax=Caballeronia sp. LZ032 TaxID=3038565 RepID=UPI00285BA425|nr:DUF883 domain-containing protein [Caballeronia sp. LZ032]MDR5878082.1 DUF883 domain-containing protein [Caballeronia sp. LZ032]
MDNANGSPSPLQPGEPPLIRHSVTTAMDAALAPGAAQEKGASVMPLTPGEAHKPSHHAPYHVHGSVLEGGDSPAVLAQPAATAAERQGSRFHPSPPADRRARDALADAQQRVAKHYRQVSEGTDDYVHDNPWKSIALAAAGGLIIGLLAAR